MLCAVDVAAVEAALSAWVLGGRTAAVRADTAAASRAAERIVLACDGKPFWAPFRMVIESRIVPAQGAYTSC